MEFLQFVPQFGKALWDLKTMYDQHIGNGKEIKELQSFIQDYDQHIPALVERLKEVGGNILGVAVLKHLETEIMEATNKLKKWSRNKSFFRVFNSPQRMQKIEKLHIKVMASVQKSLGIANLSVLLDVQATQATVLESNAELKSLLITSIQSMQGTLPSEVRDEVVEASTLSFADPKFWEDILAAVDDIHCEAFFSQEAKDLFEDPITTKLMIDPVVASDGNTYCRWTIIDNNLAKNPYNPNEDLRIVIDNLTIRRGLFETFPGQFKKFQECRNKYRSNALSLASTELLGDAILALQYVLQWNKSDKECVAVLKQVQGTLEEAKEHYIQPPLVLSDEAKSGMKINEDTLKFQGQSSVFITTKHSSLPVYVTGQSLSDSEEARLQPNNQGQAWLEPADQQNAQLKSSDVPKLWQDCTDWLKAWQKVPAPPVDMQMFWQEFVDWQKALPEPADVPMAWQEPPNQQKVQSESVHLEGQKAWQKSADWHKALLEFVNVPMAWQEPINHQKAQLDQRKAQLESSDVENLWQECADWLKTWQKVPPALTDKQMVWEEFVDWQKALPEPIDMPMAWQESTYQQEVQPESINLEG